MKKALLFIIVSLLGAFTSQAQTWTEKRTQLPPATTITVLTTQQALPYAGSAYVTGIARTNEPVMVGLPIPDSQEITSANGLGCSGSSVCGFRVLASWPDGNVKWAEFYYVDSVSAKGTDNSVSLMTGTGNVGTNLATLNSSLNTVTVNTGTGGCTFTVQFGSSQSGGSTGGYDIIHAATCNSKSLLGTTSQGLVLMGPTYSSTATTCTYASTCTQAYTSANDTSSICSIEQNTPVVAVLKCTGGLKDGSSNQYLGFLTRMYFYYGKERVQVTVSLKNDLDGASGSRNVSYMGYQSFGLSLATNLTGTNTWAIGDDGSTNAKCGTAGLCTGTLSSGQSSYLYQAYASGQYFDAEDYNTRMQFKTPALAATQGTDITRDSTNVYPRAVTYAQDGYIIVTPSGSIAMSNGSSVSPTTPMCWADVYDSSGGQGIEFATPYCAAQFPRSLQIQKGGLQITAGISPDQSLWTGTCGRPTPCQKIYYQPWPYFKVADVFLIFHDSNTNAYSESSLTREQNDFLRMQYPLISRASVSYYNRTNGFPYPLPTASAADTYLSNLASNRGHTLAALHDNAFVLTRFWDWSQGGGGNQSDWRFAYLVNRWLERGFTSDYIFTRWFDRFQEQLAWQRGDDVSCTLRGVNYHGWSCHSPSSDLNVYVGEPSQCTQKNANQCGDNSGLLPNNCVYNTGCSGGVADPVADENSSGRHYHWWSAIYDYLMTGDEDLGDMIRNGATAETTAIGTSGNYTILTANGNRSSTPYTWEAWQSTGHNNQMGGSGSYGGQLISLAEMYEFLTETESTSPLGSTITTQDVNFTQDTINNVLNVMLHEGLCVTTGLAQTGTNRSWPSGCTVNYTGSPVDQSDRGFSAYRGVFIGASDHNNISRAVPVSDQTLSSDGFGTPYPACGVGCQYIRSIEPFMEGYLVEGLWRLINYEGTSWSYYSQLRDDTYGVAVGIDNSNYITNISGFPNTYPSTSQFMYTMAADQPNTLSYFSHDANGPGPPSTGQVFAFLFNYLGSLKTSPEGVNYQSHWEGNALNSLAGSSYSPNNISLGLAYVYGTQTWDTAIYYILNPPTKQLTTVCSGAWTQSACSKSYNSGSGQWTLTWNPPAGVTQYLLKENDTLMIVESIPWNETTNEPVAGNAAVASMYPWAASNYTASQPSVNVNSIAVTAPSTASFMLKAYANPLSTGPKR